jgi:hypothetical protein
MRIYKDKKNNKGFVILYAVMISSMLLAISLGVVNISLKEIGFGTSAVDTNNAFFAADTGAECALSNDRMDPTRNRFSGTAGYEDMPCAGSFITINEDSTTSWSFFVLGIGNSGEGCAKVTVDKTNPEITSIVSKGYNIGDSSCNSLNLNRVERQIELNYTN